MKKEIIVSLWTISIPVSLYLSLISEGIFAPWLCVFIRVITIFNISGFIVTYALHLMKSNKVFR